MLKVYAHNTGQRYNWGFSVEIVEADRLKWIETVNLLNNMPLQCIGAVEAVDLSDIGETDFYVG